MQHALISAWGDGDLAMGAAGSERAADSQLAASPFTCPTLASQPRAELTSSSNT